MCKWYKKKLQKVAKIVATDLLKCKREIIYLVHYVHLKKHRVGNHKSLHLSNTEYYVELSVRLQAAASRMKPQYS